MKQVLFAIFSVLFVKIHSKNLPSYIQACKRDDPKLQDCLKKNAQLGLPGILNGDKSFHIPKLNPFKLVFVDLQPGPNLNLTMNNVTVNGVSEAQFLDVNVDLKKLTGEFTVFIPKLEFVGFYKTKGRIMVLPIAGEGPFQIVFYNGKYHFVLAYELDGEYAKYKETHLDFQLEKATFKMDNLFNGDPTLGKGMNAFLNDNWKDVINDLGKAIGETLKEIITHIFGSLLTTVPYNQLFP